MAHLFNKSEFLDYKAKVCTNFKKALDSKIDYLIAENPSVSLQPMDIQEDTVIDGINLNFTYEGDILSVPLKMLEADFADIVNMKVIQEEFNEEEIS